MAYNLRPEIDQKTCCLWIDHAKYNKTIILFHPIQMTVPSYSHLGQDGMNFEICFFAKVVANTNGRDVAYQLLFLSHVTKNIDRTSKLIK